MSTWYRVSQYGEPKITPIEVEKETTEFVVVVEEYFEKKHKNRRRKAGEFFPSFEEAKAHLVEQFTRKLKWEREACERLEKNLQQARELTQ